MVSYVIETYGCTANRGESAAIERRLRDAGHHRVEAPAQADVAILNTCTVVQTTADRMLRRADELADATADLIVTGCMALAQGEAFQEAGVGARIVHWDEVPAAVGNGECPTPTPGTEPVLDGVVGILPIARGCMSDCSYCITKRATGKIDSPPLEENVEKARALVHAGAKELRITGQDTGVYGWDTGDRKLPELLRRICELPGEFRVRVGMANPKGLHGIRHELVEVFAAYDELYDLLHAPVQSGSDAVLGDMRRQHQVGEFRDIVETFDATLEYWSLATDFIVGFPTETEADHEASLDLLRDVSPAKVHITRFSKRPGTDAAALPGLGGTVKKERSRSMTEVERAVVGGAYEAMVGDRREMLAVEPGTDDSVKCRDPAYRLVVLPEASARGIEPGEFVEVEVREARTHYAVGEPV